MVHLKLSASRLKVQRTFALNGELPHKSGVFRIESSETSDKLVLHLTLLLSHVKYNHNKDSGLYSKY